MKIHRAQSVLLLYLLVLRTLLSGQTNGSVTLDEILQNLRSQFQLVQDYQVHLEVSLDMPRFRMPRKRMTFTFKQPDQTHLEARGFAMVPRRGLALPPDSILAEMHQLRVNGDTLVNGHPCLILTGSISDPEDMPVDAKILVDRKLWVLRGIITYLDTLPVLRLSTEYIEAAPGIYLPSEAHLQFQLNEQFLHSRGSPRPYDPDFPQPEPSGTSDMHASATLKFTRYRVNQGIPDSFFEDSTSNRKK